ncbi:Response regulator receiver domain-containing protein [Franzmannia pantelleriensis]|uniref:Response regulator receiver domain-containing protein n=1 Tax=Franzmannia pantelleriensis TaxID=48727 RepID=A0A1G9GS65_9GAMM|nr:response regulator [Halomonas pantelleriensis]SDL03517.1 Response regulator receiver domain-containing protein [Halomonas pantelleriensis]
MRVDKATDSLWQRVIWPLLWPLLAAQVGVMLLCLLAWLLIWQMDARNAGSWHNLSWLLLALGVGTSLSVATFLLMLRQRLQQWESALGVPYERLERLLGIIHGDLPTWLKSERVLPFADASDGPVRRLERLLDALETLMERVAERPRFATMLNRLPIPTFITRDGKLVEANGVFEQLVGRSLNELRGLELSYLIRIDTGAEPGSQVAEVVRINGSQGGYRTFRLLSLDDGHGHCMGVLEDIVDQQQQLAQLMLSRDRAREESRLKTRYLQLLQKELAELMGLLQTPERPTPELLERIADLESLITNLVEAPQALSGEVSSPLAVRREADEGESRQAPVSRVLIVDDGPVNTMLARQVLEAEGICVDTARDGEEALRLREQCRYDLVFMDIYMHGLDGVETSRRWRDAEYEHRSILVALTANASDSDRQRFFAAGMDDYLAKPYRPQALVDMARRWLAKHA